MTAVDVVDAFAGPGGWDQGLRLARYPGTVVGLEWNAHACATRATAGHLTVRADVSTYPTAPFAGVDGAILSPPCQAFSLAGRKAGHGAVEQLLAHAYACADGWRPPPDAICGDDVRADLTLQPLRWVNDLTPRWVACEQVPPALPLWEALAEVLRGWGYSAWVGVLRAEEYGVPQTRKRAVLIARRDGQPAGPPVPTHTRYDPRRDDNGRTPTPSLLGELAPWVSLADALGWAPNDIDRRMAGAGATAQRTAGQVPRSSDEPAHTVTGGGSAAWVHNRPSTTVTGRGQIAEPGHRCMSSDCCGRGLKSQYGADSVRVTVEEAGVLQSFPADYPWQGTKTARYQQVGDAVPPKLAAAILAPLVA